MKIVVLAGGKSNERDVSLSSGSQVANALLSKGHQVLLVDLIVGLPEKLDFETAYQRYHQDRFTYEIPEIPASFSESVPEIGPNILGLCASADITFFALHGGIGENGKLQAIFDGFNIKYTGSNYEGSLLAMNKLVFKELIRSNNLNTANWTRITCLDDINKVKLPAVVKPIDNGSSIGISIVENQASLEEACGEALRHSDYSYVLVEDKIEGREFSVGILGEQVLPVIELKPKAGFYDYKNKYQQGRTEELVPAPIKESLREQMQNLAWRAHQLLGMSVCSRTDFIVSKDNQIYMIELNSLPGMTPISLLPQEAKAAGINYEDLCERIIEESLKKYEK